MTTVRAAMHAHSDWSYDAHVPLAQLASLFAQRGYDAVFMCEHDRGFTAERKRAYDDACARASEHGALMIPGIEYADAADRVHVPTWGGVPFVDHQVATIELLRRVSDHGGAAVIAHPVRREAWRVIEPAWLELCAGIEIWTRKWDGWAPNPWAVARVAEHGLVGTVALDLHRPEQTFPLAMELAVAGPVTAAACVDALRHGDCRALLARLPVQWISGGRRAGVARAVERARRPIWRRGGRLRARLTAGREYGGPAADRSHRGP
jgi:hypothetical protein